MVFVDDMRQFGTFRADTRAFRGRWSVLVADGTPTDLQAFAARIRRGWSLYRPALVGVADVKGNWATPPLPARYLVTDRARRHALELGAAPLKVGTPWWNRLMMRGPLPPYDPPKPLFTPPPVTPPKPVAKYAGGPVAGFAVRYSTASSASSTCT